MAGLVADAEFIGPPDAACSVRLLGADDGATFGWAVCGWADGSMVSLPVSVRGTDVEFPQDATYQDDVERLFPRDLIRLFHTATMNEVVDDLVSDRAPSAQP